MNIQTIPAEMLGLKPVGEDSAGPADSVLHGRIALAGCTCHVEAYQVTRQENGQLKLVNSAYEDALAALHELSGGSAPLTTASINGKDYLTSSPA